MNNSCGKPVGVRFMDLHKDCVELAVNVFGYIIPILSFCVTTINILIIIVFIKPHMRSHTTFILTLIACVEILNIVCPASVFAYHYLRGHYKEFLTSEQIRWSYILGKVFVDMLNMLSLWLTVLLAFIRYKCIISPFVAKQVHSWRKITMNVLGILVFVGLVHVPSFFIFDFKSVTAVDPFTNVTITRGGLIETEGIYLKSCSGRKLHIFIETIADSILPCAVLMGCNLKILIALRKAKRSRSSLRSNTSVFYTSEDENNYGKINRKTESYKDFISGPTKSTIEKKEEYNTNLLKRRSQDNEYKPVLSKGTVKNGEQNFSVFGHIKLHLRTRHVRTRILSDRTVDKLDRKSERTSWLIFLVSTIIIMHELPLVVLNTYTLANYSGRPLPLSRGCFSIIVLLWQFITYPAIFLIYVCMCKAFRKELLRTLTCHCRRNKTKQSSRQKHFLCPCSVRKTLPRQNARPSLVNVSDTRFASLEASKTDKRHSFKSNTL